MLPELCKTWIGSHYFVPNLQCKKSDRFCIPLFFIDCLDKISIILEEIFIKFFNIGTITILCSFGYHDLRIFSGGGATITEGALIRRNMVYLSNCHKGLL